MNSSVEPALERLVSEAFVRFEAALRRALPRTAPDLLNLLHGAPLHPQMALSPRSFPHYLLPYWLSPAEARATDEAFQADVLYSTLNGSHAIRLSDNIADNDGAEGLRKVAPCAPYFGAEFARPYMKYFSSEDAFWPYFDRYWADQAEASSADSLLKDIDEATFLSLCSRKFSATKIPITAVWLRYQNERTQLESYLHFVDRLGAFAQFNNDLLDWSHDFQFGIVTYVSCEARRRAPDRSLAGWMLAEGFDWGVSVLQSRLAQIKQDAEAFDNPALLNWVHAREAALDVDLKKARSALQLAKLFGSIAFQP